MKLGTTEHLGTEIKCATYVMGLEWMLKKGPVFADIYVLSIVRI